MYYTAGHCGPDAGGRTQRPTRHEVWPRKEAPAALHRSQAAVSIPQGTTRARGSGGIGRDEQAAPEPHTEGGGGAEAAVAAVAAVTAQASTATLGQSMGVWVEPKRRRDPASFVHRTSRCRHW